MEHLELGMLLGPEGTGARAGREAGCVGVVVSTVTAFCSPRARWGVGWGLVGGLLENCTVDASIFDLLWSSY